MKSKKKDLLYDLECEYSQSEYYSEIERRDIYYSALVKDIVKNNRVGQVLKCLFFAVVCIIFSVTCVVGLLIVFNISKKEMVSYSDIGIAIAGFGSVLSSIVVLPQIIAKHLFPKNSEEVRFEFIRRNQEFDQPIYDKIDDT
jgi:hypothetical protein